MLMAIVLYYFVLMMACINIGKEAKILQVISHITHVKKAKHPIG